MQYLLLCLFAALSANAAPVYNQEQIAETTSIYPAEVTSINPAILQQGIEEASAAFLSFHEGFPLAAEGPTAGVQFDSGVFTLPPSVERYTDVTPRALTDRRTVNTVIHKVAKVVTVTHHPLSTPAAQIESVVPVALQTASPNSPIIATYSAPIAPVNTSPSGGIDSAAGVDSQSGTSNNDKLFNIMTYREGVPYLHMRPVLLTAQNELVVDGDNDDKIFIGFLSEDRTIVSVKDKQANASVAVFSDGALKLEYSSISSPSSSSSQGVANDELNFINGNPVGPWITSMIGSTPTRSATMSNSVGGQFLTLNNAANAWACPFSYSGVYHIYWSSSADVTPTGQYGCIKVDLFIPDETLMTNNH